MAIHSIRCRGKYRMLGPVLALVLGSLLVSQPGAQAANGTYSVYFPWVSHNETIAGQGPWYGEFSVQNLGLQPCAVLVYVATSEGWIQRAQLSVAALSTRSYSSFLLGIPQPGAPVRFDAHCQVTIALKQTTPRRLARNPQHEMVPADRPDQFRLEYADPYRKLRGVEVSRRDRRTVSSRQYRGC
jgi:hypothetical protein